MIDRTKLWIGQLNELSVERAGPRRVGLYDTTLRDGEQTVGVVLNPDQKLEIARLLDELAVDRIEVGFPRVSEEDRLAVERILAAGLRAELWGFSRALVEDVRTILSLGLRATVVEAPVSDLKLKALGVDRQVMLQRIAAAISFAAEHGLRVAFFGVDASRADLAFLESAYKRAVEAGAREVVVADTLGVTAPEAAGYLVRRAIEWVGPEVPVHFHGHNDFGLATATAIAAARAGASWIHGTVNGMGERAGNTNLAEFALALEALYGMETGLRFDRVRAVSERVRELCGYALEPWKPLVGENLFRRETGTVASQFHDPPAIEPYAAELVGASRSVVLGKKSGLDSIRLKCEELGLSVPEDRLRELLNAVKSLGIRKRGLVTDSEFLALVRGNGVAGGAPAHGDPTA